VLGGLTNYHHFTVTLYDLALITDFLNGRFYFHSIFHLSLSALPGRSALCAPCYPSLCGIIDRNLYFDLITGKYLNIVHSELSGDMSGYDHIVGKLYLEGRVGQCLNYDTFKFNYVILRHNKSPLNPVLLGKGSVVGLQYFRCHVIGQR